MPEKNNLFPRLDVIVGGASASHLTAGTHNSSFLIRRNGEYLLLDAPPTLVNILLDLDIPIPQIKGIILTHNHTDHCLGLPALIHAFQEQQVQVPVYAPRQTIETMQTLLKTLSLDKPNIAFKLSYHSVAMVTGESGFNFNGLSVIAHPALHSRDTIAVCFREATGENRVVFTSDTRPSRELARFSNSADLLVHDCSGLHRYLAHFAKNHSSGRQAGEVGQLAQTKRLLLTHLDRRYFSDPDVLIREVAFVYQGEVLLAQEGMIIPV